MKISIRKIEGTNNEWQFRATKFEKSIWYDWSWFPSTVRDDIQENENLTLEQANEILMAVEEKIQTEIKFEKESATRRKNKRIGG
jgi:hypothetical protein